jgi:hypothetical protein
MEAARVMRRVVAVTVAAAVTLGLTACLGRNAPLPAPTVAVPTSTPSPRGTAAADGHGSVNVAAVLDEYDVAAKKYADDLPAGYVFPTEYPHGIGFDWAPEGTGEVTALTYWRCAWTDQFLADFDAKDTDAIDHDLDTLDAWPDFAALQYMYVDDPDQWRRDVMEPAREGHISMLRSFGRAGCVPVKADVQD